MATNEYGLDVSYSEDKLNNMLSGNGLSRYTPQELFNELNRLSLTAASQGNIKVKVQIKHPKK